MQQSCIYKSGKNMKKSRNTLAKTEVLRLIAESATALSHTEIHEFLYDTCDRVTIYRVLERLNEEGFVHKVINRDGILKYARCSDCSDIHNHEHFHFSCVKCDEVTCLNHKLPKYKLPKEYVVIETHFLLTGICPNCS